VLLQDNARPYNAVSTQAPLQHFNWELLDRAPNGHDLIPSDYHLLICLKNVPSSYTCPIFIKQKLAEKIRLQRE
jgi:hypothetical protein